MSKPIFVIKAAAGLVFLAATGSAFAASGSTSQTVQGGTINFTGSVVDAACAVDYNSGTQNINLGQVRLEELDSKGATSAEVPVKIQLDDCDSSVATTASFGFNGQTDENDPTSLNNTSTDAGAAKGVGVQMKDGASGVVPFDGSFGDGSKLTLIDGTNVANFSAYMIATGDTATAGAVASTVTFNIKYE